MYSLITSYLEKTCLVAITPGFNRSGSVRLDEECKHDFVCVPKKF